MRTQNLVFEDLFDLFAIRILVDKVEECYAVLGVVHQLNTPLQEKFKDYIFSHNIDNELNRVVHNSKTILKYYPNISYILLTCW